MRLNGNDLGSARLNGIDINEARLNGNSVFSSSPLYVQNGLMALFKGNAKTKESADKTVWKNLAGGSNFALWNFGDMTGSGWTGQSLLFDGVDDTTNDLTLPSNIYTTECVFSVTEKGAGRTPCTTRNVRASDGAGVSGFAVGYLTYNDGSNYGNFNLYHNEKVNVVSPAPAVGSVVSVTTTFNPDNNTFYIYYNGVTQRTIVNTTFTPTNKLTSGNWGTNNATFRFKGNVYCIRAYNKYLTPTEVAHNYNTDKVVYGI